MRLALVAILCLSLHPRDACSNESGIASERGISVTLVPTDSIYMEQEPLQIFVRVENHGPREVLLPSLKPKDGRLTLRLTRFDDRSSHPWRSGLFVDPFFGIEETPLEPGGVELQLLDLLGGFGDRDPARWPLSESIGQRTLRSGRYLLDGQLRLSEEGRTTSVWIAGITLEVRALEEFPEEEGLMRDWAESCMTKGATRDSVGSCSERWLARFEGRRTFPLVFYSAGFRGMGGDATGVLRRLRDAGVTEKQRAATLWVLGATLPGSRSEKLRRLEAISLGVDESFAREVVTTLTRRLGATPGGAPNR